jgi:hypothetical protein
MRHKPRGMSPGPFRIASCKAICAITLPTGHVHRHQLTIKKVYFRERDTTVLALDLAESPWCLSLPPPSLIRLIPLSIRLCRSKPAVVEESGHGMSQFPKISPLHTFLLPTTLRLESQLGSVPRRIFMGRVFRAPPLNDNSMYHRMLSANRHEGRSQYQPLELLQALARHSYSRRAERLMHVIIVAKQSPDAVETSHV